MLPTIGPLPLQWYAVVWLTPVTMPYGLLFCAAVQHGSWVFAVAIASAYLAAVCLHEALLGAGRLGEALACFFLSLSGLALAWRFWRWASPSAAVGLDEIRSIFDLFNSLLDDDD
eukprot:1030754-Amphidinium_carterae.1